MDKGKRIDGNDNILIKTDELPLIRQEVFRILLTQLSVKNSMAVMYELLDLFHLRLTDEQLALAAKIDIPKGDAAACPGVGMSHNSSNLWMRLTSIGVHRYAQNQAQTNSHPCKEENLAKDSHPV